MKGRKVTIFPYVIRTIVLLCILSGLVLQSWQVVVDYFDYATKATVKFREPPQKLIPPMIVFCVRLQGKDIAMKNPLKTLFRSDVLNDQANKWKVDGTIMPAGMKLNYVYKKFLRAGRYCMYVKVYNEFARRQLLSPRMQSRILGLPFFYYISFGPHPLLSNSTWKMTEKGCRARVAHFQVVADEADLLDPTNPYVLISMCSHNVQFFKIDMNFALTTTKKLQPPYDTMCLEYNRTSLNNGHVRTILNSHDCYQECLTTKTEKWKLVPDQGVLLRERWENSTLDIATMRLIDNGRVLKRIVDLVMKKKEYAPLRGLVTRYADLQGHWKDIQSSCRKECKMEDCSTSQIVPSIPYFEEGDKNMSLKDISIVKVALRTSNFPVLEVTYVPKQKFMDFVVYITGGVNFWLGISAISFVNIMENYIRREFKKKIVPQQPKKPLRSSPKLFTSVQSLPRESVQVPTQTLPLPRRESDGLRVLQNRQQSDCQRTVTINT